MTKICLPGMPTATQSPHKKNDVVEYRDASGEWTPGILASGRIKVDSKLGYYIVGTLKMFVYSTFVRKPKTKAGIAFVAKRAPSFEEVVTLDSVVSAKLIFDSLCAQQVHYMQRHSLQELLVPPKCLKHYAKLCAFAYANNLRKCSTSKEHRKLFNALKRKLCVDASSPEFLRSVHLEYLNLPL